MLGRNADAFGDAGAELRRGNDFGMAAITQYEAFKFVVDYHSQRQLDAAVTEALFHFLRLVEGLRLDVWSLLPVNLDNDTTRLVADGFRNSYCVVEEMLRIKVNTFPEGMHFIHFH